MSLANIALDDLSRSELLELAKRSMPWVSQRSMLAAKYCVATKKMDEIHLRLKTLAEADRLAFDVYVAATGERKRAELLIKRLDAREAYERASRAWDAAARNADSIWRAIEACNNPEVAA